MQEEHKKQIQALINDRRKAQGIIENKTFDRFDDVCTLSFWQQLAKLMAAELEYVLEEYSGAWACQHGTVIGCAKSKVPDILCVNVGQGAGCIWRWYRYE